MVRPVKLSTQCADSEELHLHIRDRHSLTTKVYPMQATPQGQWEIDVDLPPGAYLYRFYRRTGTSLVYHSPDGGPHPMANAWDAALSIPLINPSRTHLRMHIKQESVVSQAALDHADRLLG